MKTISVAGNSYPRSQNCRYHFHQYQNAVGDRLERIHTCIALFFWKVTFPSFLPISSTIDPTPPNNASFALLSVFHADIKCERRSWKACLSILTSSAILADCGCGKLWVSAGLKVMLKSRKSKPPRSALKWIQIGLGAS